jgi:hypothetical protein
VSSIAHHVGGVLVGGDAVVGVENLGAELAEIRLRAGDVAEGHPMDGENMGSWEVIVHLVDHWLDAGTLPPPYRWPPR